MNGEMVARELLTVARMLAGKGEVPPEFKEQWKKKDKDGDGKTDEKKPAFLEKIEKKGSSATAAGEAVCLSVPLLMRVMEYAKEDAQTDMDLHVAVENMLGMSDGDTVLDMSDYDDIVGGDVKEASVAMAGEYARLARMFHADGDDVRAGKCVRVARECLADEGDKCGEKGCIMQVKGGRWGIKSGKTGKMWPSTYATKGEADDVLKRYHGWGF